MARRKGKAGRTVATYEHPDKERVNNPPVGLVTPQTDQDAADKTYAHDPHLDPHLSWSGKAEHTSFEVPTVSLHVHERIDPRTIIEAVRKARDAEEQGSLFAAPEENPPLRQAIEFYRHRHNWTNRLIAGDSLIVMNSLIEKEGLGGQVQMIYMDPPYGIRYGSNFQPFVLQQLFEPTPLDGALVETFRYVELPDGHVTTLTELEKSEDRTDRYYRDHPDRVVSEHPGARIFTSENLTAGGFRKNQSVAFTYQGRDFDPGIARGNCWKHSAVREREAEPSGMERLAAANRLYVGRDQIRFKRYADDFGYKALANWWDGASNESFWLVGQPDVALEGISDGEDDGKFRVSVRGFDYYNTKTGNVESGSADKIALWMLDPDYDGRSLFPRQVFFPMAGAKDGWAKLAKSLKAEVDATRMEAYRGTVSLPFEAGEHGRAAVKIVDDRGVESLKIVELEE